MAVPNLDLEALKYEASLTNVSLQSMLIGWIAASIKFPNEVSGEMWSYAHQVAKDINATDEAKLELIDSLGSKFLDALNEWAFHDVPRVQISGVGLPKRFGLAHLYPQDERLIVFYTGTIEENSAWVRDHWISLKPIAKSLGYGILLSDWPIAITGVAEDATNVQFVVKCQWERYMKNLMDKFV